MHVRSALTAGALGLALTTAAPAVAHPGGDGGGGHHRGGHGGRYADVPARIANRLRRAESALSRAEEKADDGDSAGAVASLTAARRNLASAAKSAKKRAGQDDGPDSMAAVASVQHDVVDETSQLFDGLDGSVVDALATTLKSALDGRDDIVASATGEDYYELYESVDSDAGDEGDAIAEALSDDELTSAAKSALTDAATQLKATQTKAAALAEASDTSDAEDDAAWFDEEGF